MRADRLLSILLLLQARGRMTAESLAAELEVCERTVYRDIDALCAAGVPVYGEPGPGGGFALLDRYRTSLTGLTADEVRALFMVSIPAPLARLGVGEHLRTALRKLAASLPESRRQDPERARQRIHLDATWWRQDDERVPEELLAFACARVLVDEAAGAGADPWTAAHGWRLNTNYMRTLTLKSARGVHDVDLEYARDGYVLHHGDTHAPLAISAVDGTRLGIRFGSGTRVADVVRSGDELHVFADGRHRVLALFDVIAQSSGGDAAAGRLTAPMPGKVIAISTAAGARVERGATLLVMEAMKMEHTIVAPCDGVVEVVLYGAGEQVAEGAPLVTFAAADA